MRAVRFVVRDGDLMAGDVRSLEGALACVRQACPDLDDPEAEQVARAAMSRRIPTDVDALADVVVDVLGPDVMIERS